MLKARRSFSGSEKLDIINEAVQFGVTATLRKHKRINLIKQKNYPKLSQILTPFCPRIKGSIHFSIRVNSIYSMPYTHSLLYFQITGQ